MEGEGVGRGVPPPILKREKEEEQRDSSLGVSGELGSPTAKPPPGTSSPEGRGEEKSAGQNPEVHPDKGLNISQVATLDERPSGGFESSSEESADEGEGTLVGPDIEEAMGEETVQEQEETSVGGQSPDN